MSDQEERDSQSEDCVQDAAMLPLCRRDSGREYLARDTNSYPSKEQTQSDRRNHADVAAHLEPIADRV